MIWTRGPKGTMQAAGLLAILTILFLQANAAPVAAQNYQACPGVDTIEQAFDQDEVPEEFPDLGSSRCELLELAGPLAGLIERSTDSGKVGKLQLLAQFLGKAERSCREQQQYSAFKNLALRLEGKFPVAVNARKEEWCASLDPLVESLNQQAANARSQAQAESSREQAELPEPETLERDEFAPFMKQVSAEIDKRLVPLYDAQVNIRESLATMDRRIQAPSLPLLLLSFLSLGIASGALFVSFLRPKKAPNLDRVNRTLKDLRSEFYKLSEDELRRITHRLDLLEAGAIDRNSHTDTAGPGATSSAVDATLEPALRDEQTEGNAREAETLRATQQNIQRGLNSLKTRVEKLEKTSPPRLRAIETSTQSSPALGQLVEIEIGILQRRWVNFENSHPKIIARVRAWEQEEAALRRLVLTGLPEALSAYSEVQNLLTIALGYLREDEKWLRRLSDIPQLKDASLTSGGSVPESESRKLFERQLSRIRDAQDLLGAIETTDVGKKMERFTLEGWIRGEFLEFADDFFKNYALTDNRSGLRNARAIVVKTLNHAGVEPIEIALGRTPFDSKVHVARSDSCEPDKPDGAIVGIVRSGFRDLEKDRILQRPEVVVNRV